MLAHKVCWRACFVKGIDQSREPAGYQLSEALLQCGEHSHLASSIQSVMRAYYTSLCSVTMAKVGYSTANCLNLQSYIYDRRGLCKVDDDRGKESAAAPEIVA